MKSKLFTFLLISVLFSACSVIETIEEGIYIRVENVSEFDINDLMIETADFKTVKTSKKSIYRQVESLSLQGSLLLSSFEGSVSGKRISNDNLVIECGTGIHHIEPGKYTLEIDVVKNQNNLPGAFVFNLITE